MTFIIGNKEKDTNVFSHEDIQSQFIFYVARKVDTNSLLGNNESVLDSCEYRLTAPNVQPAMGVIEFLILPSGGSSTLVAASKNSIDPLTGQQTPGNGRPAGTDVVTENTLAGLGLGIGNDVFLIVGIVCGILGIGLLILITIKYNYIFTYIIFFYYI